MCRVLREATGTECGSVYTVRICRMFLECPPCVYVRVCIHVYVRMVRREDACSQASTDRKALLVKLSARVPTMCVNCRCGSMSRDEFMCCIRERHSYVCALCVTFFFSAAVSTAGSACHLSALLRRERMYT